MGYEKFLTWRRAGLKDEDGLIVGADITQEWLLPWWWERYRKHNTHPVAFIDFGLSLEMKDWCRQRGELIPLRIYDGFVTEKTEVDPAVVRNLEEEFGKQFWDCRKTWFKKPLACLQTRFRRTIWVDADCEIRGPVQALFAFADKPPGIAMAKDQCDAALHYPIYNSGVIVFRRNLELIVQWARNCLERNHLFRGDQEVFSRLVAETGVVIGEIPPLYNWSRCQKDHAEAIVLHWHGVYGKHVIRNQINISELSF